MALPNFPSITPQYELVKGVAFNDVVITTYPNTHEQRIATVSDDRVQFNLKFNVLTAAEMDTLWNFYIDRHGPHLPFKFTPPNEVTEYIVRFADPLMNRTLFSVALEATGLNLIEVLGEDE